MLLIGFCCFQITVSIDVDSVITVVAKELGSGSMQEYTVSRHEKSKSEGKTQVGRGVHAPLRLYHEPERSLPTSSTGSSGNADNNRYLYSSNSFNRHQSMRRERDNERTSSESGGSTASRRTSASIESGRQQNKRIQPGVKIEES